jgi:hypothetical protein
MYPIQQDSNHIFFINVSPVLFCTWVSFVTYPSQAMFYYDTVLPDRKALFVRSVTPAHFLDVGCCLDLQTHLLGVLRVVVITPYCSTTGNSLRMPRDRTRSLRVSPSCLWFTPLIAKLISWNQIYCTAPLSHVTVT